MPGRSTPAFVVTGCGRSGTGYIAALLSALGHPCGHERVFTPWITRVPALVSGSGDASWLAAPFVRGLPVGTVVLHQVRDPRAVVRSLLGIGFFDPAGLGEEVRSLPERVRRRFGRGPHRTLRSDFLDAIRRGVPTILDGRTPIERAVRYWTRWNALVEPSAPEPDHPYRRFRLETLDADELVEIDRTLGGHGERERIERVLKAVSTRTNARNRGPDVEWSTLRATSEWDVLQESALRYGYDVTEEGR